MIALGPDPLRDHMVGVCAPGCDYCAKRRRLALEAVAHAATRMLDEGGEHPTEVGLHVVSSSDWQRTSNALDALEGGREDGPMTNEAKRITVSISLTLAPGADPAEAAAEAVSLVDLNYDTRLIASVDGHEWANQNGGSDQ